MDRVSLHILPFKTATAKSKNNTQLRVAFAAVDVYSLSIPKGNAFNGAALKEVNVSYDDARSLLRSSKRLPLTRSPNGETLHEIVLNHAYKALFVQIRLTSPEAQLSFGDAESLFDLLPHSSRVISVKTDYSKTWSIFFSKADTLHRFVSNLPPFIADFSDNNKNNKNNNNNNNNSNALAIDVKYDVALLVESNFRAARLLEAFPVVYEIKGRENLGYSDEEIEFKIKEAAGKAISHIRHPYPEPVKSRGILFFRKIADAYSFIRNGLANGGMKVSSLPCPTNDSYKNYAT